MKTSADQPDLEDFKRILSGDRLRTYLTVVNQDLKEAIKLCEINTAISEALYTPLQILEITLRNSFDRVLTAKFGADWYDQNGLVTTFRQRQKINDIKIELVKDKKPLTPGGIIAGLTFGFWVTLLNKSYEKTLWIPCLSSAFEFPTKRLTLRAVNSDLHRIRKLRNRIAHHEPVLYWDLPKHHELIIEMTHWLSPVAADWSRRLTRFPAVYGDGGHWPKPN